MPLMKARDVQGQLHTLTLPAGFVNNAVSLIPLDICVGSYYPELGEMSISWPQVQEQTYILEFTLWISGHEQTIRSLSVKTRNGRSGVDVSALASDVYDYRIDYFIRPLRKLAFR